MSELNFIINVYIINETFTCILDFKPLFSVRTLRITQTRI